MTYYDYKVIPAPAKAPRAKGAKTPDARKARQMEDLLNEMASDGWEFQRAETLPSEERQGLTQTAMTFRTVLVFRRPQSAESDGFEPKLLPPATIDDDDDDEAQPAAVSPPTPLQDAPASDDDPDHIAEADAEEEAVAPKEQSPDEMNAVLRDRVAQLMQKVRE